MRCWDWVIGNIAQVVAGLIYKFDLVLGSAAGCEEDAEKRCSMNVYSVPWQQEMSVQWENVQCGAGEEEEVTTKANRIRLSVPLIRDIPQVRVGIVDLSDHTLLGSDDHDKIPHTKPLLGSDDHDKIPHTKPLFGSDGHDLIRHGLMMGSSAHGPRFDDDYTVKELKSKADSSAELKQLQSLGAFHEFMSEHGKKYVDRAEYKLRYGVYRDNMKKVQFLRETDQGTAEYGATEFADLTETEYKQHLGLTPVWKSRSLSEDPISWPAADIPDVEVRNISVLSGGNQLLCLSCPGGLTGETRMP